MDETKLRARDYMKKYYQEHRREAIQKASLWNKQHPERRRQIVSIAEKKFNQTPRGIYGILKDNSRRKGRGFVLGQLDFIKWYEEATKVCHYCGIPQNGKRLEIDRKDNNLGYVIENMVLACRDCNGVKGNILSYEEMKDVGNLVMKKRWKK